MVGRNTLLIMFMSKNPYKTCCFSPVTDTWLKSIQNGHFATWPSVTVENVRKYLGTSDATAQGHLNQIRQNIRSTQQGEVIMAPETIMVQEDNCHYLYTTTLEPIKSTPISRADSQQHR
jgi:hypothetical protein